MNSIADKMANPETKFDAIKIRDGAKDFYDLDKTVQTYVQVYKKVLG